MGRRDLESSDPIAGSRRSDLRDELERLGVAPDDAGPLAARLRELAGGLPVHEVRALLEGAALGRRAAPVPAAKAPELHRILEDFATELKKLDEGLRLLTAYLARLRNYAATQDSSRTLH